MLTFSFFILLLGGAVGGQRRRSVQSCRARRCGQREDPGTTTTNVPSATTIYLCAALSFLYLHFLLLPFSLLQRYVFLKRYVFYYLFFLIVFFIASKRSVLCLSYPILCFDVFHPLSHPCRPPAVPLGPGSGDSPHRGPGHWRRGGAGHPKQALGRAQWPHSNAPAGGTHARIEF